MHGKTLAQIDTANDIIEEYQALGLTLMVRQLYYQFVSRQLIPNTKKSCDRFTATISNGRDSGRIDWDAIEGRGRTASRVYGAETATDVLEGIESQLIIDPWRHQENYVEVWIEKEALIGTVSAAANR